MDEELRNAVVAFIGEWFSVGGKVPSQESIERYVDKMLGESGEAWFVEWFRRFREQHGRYPSFAEMRASRTLKN